MNQLPSIRKRPGPALRGTSELHAWGDTNLSLARPAGGTEIGLTVEHRAAPSCEPVTLRLVSEGDLAHLEMACPSAAPPRAPTPWSADLWSAEHRILPLFAATSRPLRIRTLRPLAGLRHETVTLAVAALVRRGVLELTDHGDRLVEFPAD